MNKFLVLILVLVTSCQPKKETATESINSTDSKIILKDLEGKQIDLNEKITVLNLWATWCKPCIAEMPDLEKMQKQLPAGFELLLASDEPLERQLKFINKQERDLTYVQITSSLEVLGVYALPTTLIIDSEGNILKTMVGTRAWNTPEQIEQITSLLK